MMLAGSSTHHSVVSSSRVRQQGARCALRHTAQRSPAASGWTPSGTQHICRAAQDASGSSTSTRVFEQATSSSKAAHGRGIVFSIDDTAGASEALSWGIENVLQPGEQVHLVHVVLDTRTPVTSTGTGLRSYDSLDMVVRRSPDYQAHQQRLQDSAQHVVEERAGKLLSKAGVEYEVSLPLLPGARSAATIGDAICKAANGSRLLVVSNHGPGVLAEFGSVARYAYQHAPVPLALVPSLGESDGSVKPAVLLVVQSGAELEQCLAYAQEDVLRAGDALHILQAGTDATTELSIEPAVQQSLSSKGVADVVVTSVADQPDIEARGQKVCDAAASLRARAVIMVNYASKGMLQEVVNGSLTSYVSRHTSQPLILLGA